MVFPGEGDSMATGHERPKKALHNFRLSSWGIQQKLKCVKVEPHVGSGGEEGIEEFTEKMMLDIRTARESILREHSLGYEEEEDDHTNERDESEQPRKKEREREVSSSTVEVKRWNFRKRRGDCEAPLIELGFVEEKVNTRPTFTLALSKKEVEDDMRLMGLPPSRRPKKRSRALQKKINLLHPAFYFSEEVTEDIYYDSAEKGKRR